MKHFLLAVMTSLMACGSVQAQTKCDKHGAGCTYDFSVDANGYMPDWTLQDALGGNNYGVGGGSGVFRIWSASGAIYDSNHLHATWTAAGAGFSWVRTTVAFVSDAGKPGWYSKLSDGRVSCQLSQHATRASDSMVMLTLYDDGESYLGGFIGGDLWPLGVLDVPRPGEPGKRYAVVGVVRKLAGQAPKVLDWMVGPPIVLGGQDKHLTVSIVKDREQWTLRAKGDQLEDGRQWEAEALLDEEPDASLGVGLDAIVEPYSKCLADGVSRVMTVGPVEARY